MVQKCGVHQLRLVSYPIVYRVLYIPGGCLGFLNHQQYGCLAWESVDFIFLQETESQTSLESWSWKLHLESTFGGI